MIVETSVFVHHVQMQVEHVMKSPPVGLGQKHVTFANPRPSCPDYLEDAKCDQFKLIIPYAGVPVQCLVMFQASQPSCPPDFIFADSRYIVPLDKITDLWKWNTHDSSGLFEILKQLLHYYKLKQIDLLEAFYTLHQEYLSVSSSGKYGDNDIEVYVPPNKQLPVSFLVRLKPNLQNIPHGYFKNFNRNCLFPLLLVLYSSHDKRKSHFKLYLPIELESILSVAGNLKLPVYHGNLSLGKYLEMIENHLELQAESIVSSFELRKKYVVTFLSYLESCVLEYDFELYSKISFIVEKEGSFIIVQINIPLSYPAAIPELTFRSMYHSSDGIPTCITTDSYPFESNWTLNRIFLETMNYIEKNASLIS